MAADHAGCVLPRQNGRIVLRKPWGGAVAEISLTLAELKANFQAVSHAT